MRCAVHCMVLSFISGSDVSVIYVHSNVFHLPFIPSSSGRAKGWIL